jgi:hypothetical protein
MAQLKKKETVIVMITAPIDRKDLLSLLRKRCPLLIGYRLGVGFV